MAIRNKKGKLFIIVGPSGVGKGTIIEKILKERKDIVLSVSKTTRKKREGEIEGKNYFFVSKETFENEIKDGMFLEHKKFFKNLYGTPKSFVLDNLDKGKSVILEIETMGAKDVLKNYKDTVSIFILPPSLNDLKERLEERGSETKSEIELRIKKAKVEMKEKKLFKYSVINDDVDDACKKTLEIMDKELE